MTDPAKRERAALDVPRSTNEVRPVRGHGLGSARLLRHRCETNGDRGRFVLSAEDA